MKSRFWLTDSVFHTAAPKKKKKWPSAALHTVHPFILVQRVQVIAKAYHCSRKVENSWVALSLWTCQWLCGIQASRELRILPSLVQIISMLCNRLNNPCKRWRELRWSSFAKWPTEDSLETFSSSRRVCEGCWRCKSSLHSGKLGKLDFHTSSVCRYLAHFEGFFPQDELFYIESKGDYLLS